MRQAHLISLFFLSQGGMKVEFHEHSDANLKIAVSLSTFPAV